MLKNIKVTTLDDETRIDRWLKRHFTSLSQNFIEKNLRKGIIKVNDNKIKSNYIVIAGDTINIYGFLEKNYSSSNIIHKYKILPAEILKEFNKSIIYQNSDFIIINKWTGISTQEGSKNQISIDDIIKNLSKHYNLVHRLDKETSGLLIIAKNLKATRLFGKLLKEQKIDKIYISLCHGIPKNLNSTVKLKIKDKKNVNNNIQTITKYKVIKTQNKISLNLFKPLTGKKHQLRIVSKYLNCPIVGDRKYNIGNNYYSEKLKLNACYIKFNFKGQEFEFQSTLPSHFLDFMKKNKLNFKLNKYINNFSQIF